MTEIWKPIEGTNGKYEVSNTGKVRSLNYLGHGKTQELKSTPDRKGYQRISLYCDGVRLRGKVHRLVAMTFIPNPEGKPEVNHINGIKSDNRVENLEWATAKENSIHAYKSGLKEKTREHCRQMGITIGRATLEQARAKRMTPVIATRICDGFKTEYASQSEAMAGTGARQANIHKVLNGKRKSANGYTFSYKNKGVVEK